MTFAFYANGQSGKGTVLVVAPDLDTSTNVPRRSYTCTSPRQAMTFTLQNTTPDAVHRQAAPARPATTAYVYDRHGRIIGSTTH